MTIFSMLPYNYFQPFKTRFLRLKRAKTYKLKTECQTTAYVTHFQSLVKSDKTKIVCSVRLNNAQKTFISRRSDYSACADLNEWGSPCSLRNQLGDWLLVDSRLKTYEFVSAICRA